jgi:hypothetical protein
MGARTSVVRLAVIAGFFLLFAPRAQAEPVVVTFDDLPPVPFGLVPFHYGGIDWGDQWGHTLSLVDPYHARSAPQAAFVTVGTSPGATAEFPLLFTTPNQYFKGAYFSGPSDLGEFGAGLIPFIKFFLYDDGVLVSTSQSLLLSPTATFLRNTYRGPIDAVGVVSNSPSFWVMDDFTYTSSQAVVPEPTTCALVGVGALVCATRRRRCSTTRVEDPNR